MNSRGNDVASKRRRISRKTAASAVSDSTSKPRTFSLKMALYVAKFMRFQDYRRFIMSLYPNNDLSDPIRKKLWELSTYRIETMFISGRPLMMEYNFDPTRPRCYRILMNVESLLPILGGIMSPEMKKFAGISELTDFVKVHTHLNECSGGRFAACACHSTNKNGRGFGTFEKPLTDACPYGHYHHYCSHIVAGWLNIFEINMVLLQEQRHQSNDNRACRFVLSAEEFVNAHGIQMQRHDSVLYGMLSA
ncbi:repeat element 22 [Diadegma semiclausum ichnovirus]|nr:repeat element 22 [Diadegma semiclausum ichnovirus]